MLSYNWVREHGALGTTPAVAAGLIKHRWSVAWIAELGELYHESARDVERRAAAARADRQRVHLIGSQGRLIHYPTLQSIAAVMGMRLFIAGAEPGGMEAPPLPAELTRALDLPSDASVVDAVEAIDQDAVASTLRKGMRLVLEMTTELATAAAELLPQVAVGSTTTRMIPFAEHVRFEADTGEVAFEESSDLSIAVAERVLPSLGASGLPDVRPDSRRFAGAGGRRSRRRPQGPPGAVDEQLFLVRIGEALVFKGFSAGRRSVEPGQRQLGSSAETLDRRRSHRGQGSVVWPAQRCSRLTGAHSRPAWPAAGRVARTNITHAAGQLAPSGGRP